MGYRTHNTRHNAQSSRLMDEELGLLTIDTEELSELADQASPDVRDILSNIMRIVDLQQDHIAAHNAERHIAMDDMVQINFDDYPCLMAFFMVVYFGLIAILVVIIMCSVYYS